MQPKEETARGPGNADGVVIGVGVGEAVLVIHVVDAAARWLTHNSCIHVVQSFKSARNLSDDSEIKMFKSS